MSIINLDRFANTTVTRTTRTLSRRSFQTVMLVAYHAGIWPLARRSQEYSSSAAMKSDGFPAEHPLVLAAIRLEAQGMRRWKVGKRLGAPVQTTRLTPSAPSEGELFSVSIGGVTFGIAAQSGDVEADVCDDLVALINPDADAIIATIGSTAGVQTLSGAALNGVVGGAEISPPRNLTFTINGHADWDASTGIVTGLDANGRVQTENVAIPNGLGAGAQVVTLSKIWSQITSFYIPAQSGTGGTATLGTGKVFALDADDASLVTITAADNTTYVGIVADVTGAWYPYTDLTSNLGFLDVTPEPATTLATDLDEIKASDANWYGLAVVDAKSPAQIEAIAEWAEANDVWYVGHSADSVVKTNVATDVATLLLEASYFRTTPFWSRRNHGRAPDAGLLGFVLSRDPGSVDVDYKTIVGLLPDDITADELTILTGSPESPLEGKRCTVYIAIGATGTNTGTPIAWGGMVSGGEWVDVVVGIDAFRADAQASATVVRLAAARLPYTAAGISALEGAARSSAQRFAAAPYNVLVESSIEVDSTPIEETTSEQRQARHYDGINVGAQVQGAIRVFNIRLNVAA